MDRITKTGRMKSDARAYAAESIWEIMIQEARRVGMEVDGRLVQSFDDIRESWKQDPSVEQEARVYAVTYGIFDRTPRWEIALEEKFMAARGWKYSDTAAPTIDEPSLTEKKIRQPKGCIAKNISNVKGDLVKQIGKPARLQHGSKVKIRRTKEEINEKNRYRKRKNAQVPYLVVKVMYFVLMSITIIFLFRKKVMVDDFITNRVSPTDFRTAKTGRHCISKSR
jgi:hypothetical protein